MATRHIGVHLDYVELRARQGVSLIDEDGKRMTPAAILIYCKEARAEGLSFVPSCDNTRSDGHCAGHEEGR